MKEKLLFIALIFLFISSVLFVKSTFAEETVLSTDSASIKYVGYDLAYPGILPDSPIYKLKVLRDKLSLFMISDPKKKIEFYLLQTDKGILSTAILVDKNEIDLAAQTALKAEHNYTLLTQQLGRFEKKPSQDFFNKLKKASLKHQEVLESLIKRIPESKKDVFKQVLNFSKQNYKTVETFQNQKRYLYK